MARQPYYLDTRVLTAFFFAAMPFVAFGSFIVVNTARTRLRESAGISLEQRAVQTKLALEQYMAERALHLRVLALTNEVQQALASPPRTIPDSDAARLEQDWLAGKDPKLAARLLDSPLAARLRILSSVRPSIRNIQVIDAAGQVVAASSRGGRIFHRDTTWFKDFMSQEAAGEMHVGDIQRPRGSTLTLLELCHPVHSADGSWIGAVRALVDATDLYTVLAPVRVGRTGHAVLLRASDGLVLASDESERILKVPLPGFDSLRNAIEGFPIGESGEALFGRSRTRRGYWTIPEVRGRSEGTEGREIAVEPARLVGFSPVDLPDVRWLVAVEQDLQEALAPIETVTRYLWVHFIGVFATVVLLALYFSFKLERPVMEEALHLHEEHLPAGMSHEPGV